MITLKDKNMINKCIYFVDFKEQVLEEAIKRNDLNSNIQITYLKEAITILIRENYRYYVNRGLTRNNSLGLVAKYVDEVPKYDNDNEAAISEFAGYLRNEAGKLQRAKII